MRDHWIARYLGCRVWELPMVPRRFKEEAHTILVARFGARMQIAKDHKIPAYKIVLPDY